MQSSAPQLTSALNGRPQQSNVSQLAGPMMIFASACGFGLNPLFVQFLAQEGFDTLATTFYRFAIPGLICAGFLPLARALWPEAGRMLGLGMLNGIGAYCYFDALQTIPVSLAILIYYTYPVFCVIIGWGWRKRRPCRNASLAAMLILIAVSLVATPETLRGVPVSAMLSCAIAPLIFAAHIQYLAKPAQHIPATGRIAWSSAGHLVILVPMMLLSPPEQLLPHSVSGLYGLLGIAIIAATIPQFMFLAGVKRTAPEQVAIIGASELIIAMLTGTWFMQQPLGQPEITAMLLICIALMIRTHKEVQAPA
ncbi:DMT family transporter [Aliamphritea hakodatensis]|uniref:DMT family transporter n=1 Tax=Aliamphritea hakodatensis TaxID=2895352 RepID=UPI0022FD94CB|nr:DMT family transporter [Aliamphritea hakodatensis]